MKILEFLADLATDTELMSAFRSAPGAVLSARGISEQDRHLLLSGDPIALRTAVAAAVAAQREAGRWTAGPPGRAVMHDPPTEHPPTHPCHEPPTEHQTPLPHSEPPTEHQTPMPNSPTPFTEHQTPLPNSEPPTEHQTSRPSPGMTDAHEPEALQMEPLDLELDLAQDAVLIGGPSERIADSEPGGVWGLKGLTVVGTGMRAGLHMTQETRLALQQASKVLYLVADPISEACILKLHPGAESLGPLYEVGKPRIEIYENMIAKILGELESAGNLCVAFYGHPGVLSYPAWESIRRARATGKRARMLPAISTEDCLFADLGVDIARAGLQSFEATRFLYYKCNFDPCAGLVLWQVGVLGENKWNPPHTGAQPRLKVLTEYLEKFYGPEHDVFFYHAPEYPTSRPLVERLPLHSLPSAEFISISTLYIPPRGQPEPNFENLKALERATAGK